MCWRGRDQGRWHVFEMFDDGEPVGVLVLEFEHLNGGKVLDLLAAKCVPGRWADVIDEFCTAVAEAAGCFAIRLNSPRPVHRLRPGFKPYDTWYIRELHNGQR